MNEINDKRSIQEFRGITFSGFKKSEAKKELLNSLNGGKIEQACYWSGEFVCACHYLDIWEIILLYCAKHIHLGNPNLPRYINMRYENFKNIVNDGFDGNEIVLRNNPKVRKLFAEIMCILCLAKKKHQFSSQKIKKTDFESLELTDKLKAKSIEYAKDIFNKEDPNELFIAINELTYNLKETKNVSMCCYWVEWILEFETLAKKEKKKKFICHRREFAPVEEQYQKDSIWIIWNIFLHLSLHRKNLREIIKGLMSIFSIRFKPGSKKKRKFLIYFAISLFTEHYNILTPIFNNNDKSKIENIKEKINIIYQQIKKNEIKPKTDYLFNNSICEKTKNLENTISKLDKLENMTGFIPRN
jgi:hypothetical protein